MKVHYGIQIGLIYVPHDNSAGIHIQTQQNDENNYGILFQDGGNGDKHNAISWGELTDPTTMRHLYIKKSDGKLYTNINDVETEVGGAGGGGVSSLQGFTGDINISSDLGNHISDNGLDTIIINTRSRTVFAQNASTTVANTATQTTLTNTGAGSLTLPADFFEPGVTLRVITRGYFGTDGLASPTLNIRVKLGSTVVAVTGDITIGVGFTNQFWQMETYITCQTDGATGTVVGHGTVVLPVTAASTAIRALPMISTSTFTIDTTGTLALDVTADWDSADADNTITAQVLTVERLEGQ